MAYQAIVALMALLRGTERERGRRGREGGRETCSV